MRPYRGAGIAGPEAIQAAVRQILFALTWKDLGMKPFAIAALAAAVATPALAAGPTPVESAPVVMAAPAPPPGYDWTGFYAGAQIGYGDFGANTGIPNANGTIYGVHAGYMWDMGTWVWGIEGDYDGADVTFVTGEDVDYVARLKFRAGYDAGRTLIYATAGPAWMKVSNAGVDLSDGGWFAGVGLGTALGNQWIVGAEILAHQFDNFDGTGVDLDATTVTLRASYRF